tara:strand:+ start:353 stop:568 length:216 start_codon:yes stop_codon:yes gene_type:complete
MHGKDVPNSTIWGLAQEMGAEIKVTFPNSEYDRLGDCVGSLVISQFDNQDDYRAVINELFQGWVDNGELGD